MALFSTSFNASDQQELGGDEGDPELVFRYSSSVTSWLVGAYVAIFVIGLVGNGFVVAVVHSTPRMRTTTNLLLVNLAVADILVLLICVPANLVANILLPWVLGNTMCKLVAYLQNVTVSASINTLIAISIDRYMAICHDPLRCQPLSSFAVQRHVLVIWSLAIAIMLPTLVYQNQYVNEHYGVPMCGLTFPSQWVEQVFFCLVVLLCYALPLLFIVLSYCFIFHTVSNRHMIGEDTAPRLSEDNGLARAKNNQRMLIHRSKVKVLRMICIVVLVFFVSWGPLYLINGYINLFGYPRRGERLESLIFSMFPLAQWLGLANSAINPLIYAYFNKKFRHGFVSLVRTNGCCGIFSDDPVGSSRSRSSSIPLSTYLSRRFTIDQSATMKATNDQPQNLL